MIIKKDYVPSNVLENLKKHRWVVEECSFMEKILNPKWDWLVAKLFPVWLAPNVVTLMGLSCPLIICIMTMMDDMTMTKRLDQEYYIMMSVALFIYCHMDCMDGKQARRTGSGSPLGMLFDHGSDAIILQLFIFINIQVCQLGSNEMYFEMITACYLIWYGANWKEGHTHVFICHWNGFGVVEIETIQQIAIFICAFINPTTLRIRDMGGLIGLQIDENQVYAFMEQGKTLVGIKDQAF